ncbi:MAG: hypothetical protein N3A69_17770 [Leptospiraceae bacterium]|nr:hypothetical protein [Leptospiraceae bacterium]
MQATNRFQSWKTPDLVILLTPNLKVEMLEHEDTIYGIKLSFIPYEKMGAFTFLFQKSGNGYFCKFNESAKSQ